MHGTSVPARTCSCVRIRTRVRAYAQTRMHAGVVRCIHYLNLCACAYWCVRVCTQHECVWKCVRACASLANTCADAIACARLCNDEGSHRSTVPSCWRAQRRLLLSQDSSPQTYKKPLHRSHASPHHHQCLPHPCRTLLCALQSLPKKRPHCRDRRPALVCKVPLRFASVLVLLRSALLCVLVASALL